MKALVLENYGSFLYTDVPDPKPEDNEVLVAVRACGICGSDVHGMDGSTGRRRPPIIMGHEAAGEIVAKGVGVQDWNAGERVTFDSTIYCGTCRFCQQGRVNLCDNRKVLGVSCADYRRHGAFAEFVAVPARILYRLPDPVTFEQAALVEAASVAVHAVSRARLKPGDTGLVVGSGMIGLLVVQALRAAGCESVIAVDPDADRLRRARSCGATRVVPPGPGLSDEVSAATGGRGADVSFEVVGNPDAFQSAIGSVRKGGTVVLVGNLSPKVELPLQDAVTRELDILGSCASAGEYPAVLDLMARNAINVDSLISATAPLSAGDSWFSRLYAREPGLMKVVLRP
jgi:L-iditol 2-dehydrogenase